MEGRVRRAEGRVRRKARRNGRTRRRKREGAEGGRKEGGKGGDDDRKVKKHVERTGVGREVHHIVGEAIKGGEGRA